MDEQRDSRLHVKRVVWGTLAAVAAIVVLADIAWLVWVGEKPSSPPPQTAIDPAEETTAPPMPSILPTESSAPTTSVDSTTPPAAEPPPATSPFTRAARIAFRLGATVYVANEDGSSPTPVAAVAEGPFALSPDGLTLAVIADGRLKLFDTSTGAAVDAAAATDMHPVWMPDSSEVIYARKTGHGQMRDIRRIRRDGTGDGSLRAGFAVSVSPNGRVIAVLPVEDTKGQVYVSVDGGRFKRFSVGTGSPTAVAAGDARVYVAVNGTNGAWIGSVGLDGGGRSKLVGAPAGDVPAIWGSMCLSPAGTHLGVAAEGDDEYSRVGIIPLPRGTSTQVGLRRDSYLRCWSTDGRYLLYVEGNAYQGEPTILYRVEADGSDRRVVATGAE